MKSWRANGIFQIATVLQFHQVVLISFGRLDWRNPDYARTDNWFHWLTSHTSCPQGRTFGQYDHQKLVDAIFNLIRLRTAVSSVFVGDQQLFGKRDSCTDDFQYL